MMGYYLSIVINFKFNLVFSDFKSWNKSKQAMESIVFQFVLITEEGLIGGIVEMEPGWKA